MAKIELVDREEQLRRNLGTRGVRSLPMADYPDADAILSGQERPRPEGAVDVMLVNPPAPDGGIWIRSQHRVGRRSRENMIWPQVSLAQMAALLHPDYTVEVVDAIATRMSWPEFEKLLTEKHPKYYLTQVTACQHLELSQTDLLVHACPLGHEAEFQERPLRIHEIREACRARGKCCAGRAESLLGFWHQRVAKERELAPRILVMKEGKTQICRKRVCLLEQGAFCCLEVGFRLTCASAVLAPPEGK